MKCGYFHYFSHISLPQKLKRGKVCPFDQSQESQVDTWSPVSLDRHLSNFSWRFFWNWTEHIFFYSWFNFTSHCSRK
jgi:hypothetical protein